MLVKKRSTISRQIPVYQLSCLSKTFLWCFALNHKNISALFFPLSTVLQRCKGLVAVWFLFLHATGMYCHLLYANDLWNVKQKKQQLENCSQWTPEAGKYIRNTNVWKYCSSPCGLHQKYFKVYLNIVKYRSRKWGCGLFMMLRHSFKPGTKD